MGKYIVVHPVKIDGERLFPSDDQIIDVEDRVAKQHVKTGSLKPYKASNRQSGNDDQPRLQDVVTAISKLSPDNENHWTASGKPQTGALSEIVGKAVSASMRDKAWAKVQAEAKTAAEAEETEAES